MNPNQNLFGLPSGLQFAKFRFLDAPQRLIDTRVVTGATTACLLPAATLPAGTHSTGLPDTEIVVRSYCSKIPPEAIGINAIVFVLNQAANGWITFYPGDQVYPKAASATYFTAEAGSGTTVPFNVSLSASKGSIRIFTSQVIDIIIDLVGYYVIE